MRQGADSPERARELIARGEEVLAEEMLRRLLRRNRKDVAALEAQVLLHERRGG